MRYVLDFVHQLLEDGALGERIAAMPAPEPLPRPLFDFHDIEAICRFSPAKHSLTIRLSFFGKDLDYAAYLDSRGYYDFARIERLHQGGATVVANEVHAFSGSVYRLKLQLEQQLHCDVGINCYATPMNCQGLARHVDSHGVVIIQLQGRKSWQLFDRASLLGGKYTMDGFTPIEPTEERTLSAGDLLYVPEGFVHAAKSAGETTSLHLAVGFSLPTLSTLLNAWVDSAVHVDPTLNALISPRSLRPEDDGQELGHLAEEALRKLAAIPLAEARRQVANYQGKESYLDFELAGADIGLDALTPATLLCKTSGTTSALFSGVFRLRHKSGRLLELKPECAAAWAEIDRRSIFCPPDLAGKIPQDKESLFCYYLLNNGLLARADSHGVA